MRCPRRAIARLASPRLGDMAGVDELLDHEHHEAQLRAARALEREADFHDRTARIMSAGHDEPSADEHRVEADKCRTRAAEQRRLAVE